LDAKQALSHPWIVNNSESESEPRISLSDNVIQRIANFSTASKIQQIALNFIAHQCEAEDIAENKKIFFNIDKNNDGYITLKELKQAMQGRLSEDQLHKVLRAVDTDKNGAINYTEFIAATLKSEVFSNNKNI
jgi:calcium-dependent protein kinase